MISNTNPKTLEAILRQVAIAIRPVDNLKVSETAEKHRKLNNPGSYVGPWRNGFAPYLVEIMDECGSLTKDAVIFAGPARCGKSDIFFNYLTHIQLTDPSDLLLVHMTKTTARDWSLGDLRKVFRATTSLGSLVMPGRHNMNVHDIQFIGDTRLLVKWPTIAELSGKTIPRHWLMDYDRMPEDVEDEGPPFHLTKKRGDTFSVSYRMTVAESSPGFKVEPLEDGREWIPETPHEAPPTKGILSLYNTGDRRRWYWRCASCDEPFEGDFCHLIWDRSISDPFTASKTVRLKCPHCDFQHTHDADPANGQPGKAGLNLRGKWLRDGEVWNDDGTVSGEPVISTTASFWLKGVAAAFSTWQQLVFKYLSAKQVLRRTGSDADLKTTVNVDQGHPYQPDDKGDQLQPETLMKRPKTFAKGVVPDNVRFLVATIDTQDNRFEVMVTGFDASGSAYIVDRFPIKYSKRMDDDMEGQFHPVDPAAHPQDWDLIIEEVIEKTYPLADESGRQMAIKLSAVDSGGKDGFTVNAYSFWKRLKNDELKRGYDKKFVLLKGASSVDAPRFRIGFPDTERKDRKAKARGEIPVGFIGTLIMKDRAYGMLCAEEGPGRVCFPEGLGRWFYRELLAETRVDTPTKAKWENLKKARNESWDLLVYAISILLHRSIGYEKINWESPPDWAEEWDQNTLVFEPNDEGVYEMVEEEPTSALANLGALLA